METENKQRKVLTIIGLIMAIILIIVGTGYVIAADYTEWGLADEAASSSGVFWGAQVGQSITTGNSSVTRQQWLCLTHNDNNPLDGDSKIRAILDINVNGDGTFTTRYDNMGEALTYTSVGNPNGNRAMQIAYLCYAATYAGAPGYAADEHRYSGG